MCEAEVASEDAVEGDNKSNGLIESAVMLIRGIVRTIKCHIDSSTHEPLSDESLILSWLVERVGCILSRCQNGRDGKSHLKDCMARTVTIICPISLESVATQISTDPVNRMNPRYMFEIWFGMRNHIAKSFSECRWWIQSS